MTLPQFHNDDVVQHDDGRFGVVVKVFEGRHCNDWVVIEFDDGCEIVRGSKLHAAPDWRVRQTDDTTLLRHILKWPEITPERVPAPAP